MTLFNSIVDFLNNGSVSFELKHHPPTPTSEEAAKARGEPLKIGAKALLVKGDEKFVLLVIPANLRLDTKKVKKLLHTRNLRFATAEELKQMAGVEKGGLPPFGFLFGVEMIVDTRLFEEEWMAFNAGSLEQSIKMRTEDYRKAVKPRVGEMAER